MSESCLNAGRGGRRGRERDSKALSRVCARRAALALPGRAREGARGPEARAGPRVLVGARMQRGAPGGRLGSASAARLRRLAELRLGPGGARRERSGRAGGGAPVRAAVRLHVTAAPSPARPGSGAFCAWERRPVAALISAPGFGGMDCPPRRGQVSASELLAFPGGTILVFLSEAAINILLALADSGDRGWAFHSHFSVRSDLREVRMDVKKQLRRLLCK
ncbi:uncharacterized protein LOC111183290 [Delphinapterus leucas]|uniref:Uncharacterized protein LOC111183290 n=1 Tax=Delphinapterus leucas TaxID=9749 RepID=A0A2Y9PS44_DELLE|nr:uncharacterized protein LOC111183290 [Delphinapterus leucas]